MSCNDPSELPFDPAKLRDKNFRVPDIIGCVEGWRAWGVEAKLPKYGVAPKLVSVSFTAYYWTPRKAAQAHCRRACEGADGVGVPGEDCECGFYSAKTLEHLQSMRYHAYDADVRGLFHIVGRVANWGKVIEGSQGWRSQFSYPVELFVPFEAARTLAKPLSEAYGVPCRLKNHLRTEGVSLADAV